MFSGCDWRKKSKIKIDISFHQNFLLTCRLKVKMHKDWAWPGERMCHHWVQRRLNWIPYTAGYRERERERLCDRNKQVRSPVKVKHKTREKNGLPSLTNCLEDNEKAITVYFQVRFLSKLHLDVRKIIFFNTPTEYCRLNRKVLTVY